MIARVIAIVVWLVSPAAHAVELAFGAETFAEAQSSESRWGGGGGLGLSLELHIPVHDGLEVTPWTDLSRSAFPKAKMAFASWRVGARIQPDHGFVRPFFSLFGEWVFAGTTPDASPTYGFRGGEELGIEFVGHDARSYKPAARFGAALRAAQPLNVNAPDTPFLSIGIFLSAKFSIDV